MKNNEKGQSLVEAIIAMTAAILVVSSIVAAVVASLNNAQFSKYQNLATQYAQEGIEVVKQKSVANWSTFYSMVDINYCLPEGSSVLNTDIPCLPNVYQVGTPPTFIFKRSIKLERDSIDCSSVGAKVTSTVAWSDSKCTSGGDIYCHSVVLRTCILKSQNISTP